MRKTKLIILPTKCLNRMGFLLLFLSCPVIGDWGRIRPDTEMSQWSILLDKEGSCGLTRNSPQNELATDGRKDHQEVGGDITPTDKLPMAAKFIETETSEPEASARIQRNSERRMASREIRERRTVSLDRKKAFRQVENSRRNYRAITQESSRRNDARRLSLERRTRYNNGLTRNNSQRRLNREGDLRRVENEAERRMEERRLSMRVESNDRIARRVSSERGRLSRVGNAEARNAREMRERREDRRVVSGDRRSSESEMLQDRRKDNGEGRLSARRVDMRRSTSGERNSDGRRTTRGSTARREQSGTEMRRNAVTSAARRNERSFERRDSLQRREARRVVAGLFRRQDVRAGKFQDRELNAREKMARIDGYMGPQSRIAKQKQIKNPEGLEWDFFGGIKKWFYQKTNPDVGVVNNDFATTCLVGATVYLLTTQQIKAI